MNYKIKQLLLITLTLITIKLSAQYQGPIPPISSGYGADETQTINVINITNNHFALKDISVFFPQGTTTPIPTIFFSHGYGANDTSQYIKTLRHIASKGYAVVFVPYKTIGVTIPERYSTLFDGFTKAARDLSSIIDTSRVGFYGHSFGGGATPKVSYRAFTENNWGANAKFIFCSAPWYSYELGNTNLSNYPTDCNMLTVLYNDDDTNDHRMGMDIFNNIAIDGSIKDCVMVYSDTISTYTYEGNHNLPSQAGNGEFDALDYYVTFRLLDALADFTFTGNLVAKNIALGNGSPAQIDMGGQLSPLSVTDMPTPIYPEANYIFPCNSMDNERQAFCQTILGVDDEAIKKDKIEIYPNPTNGQLKLYAKITYQELKVSILDISGQKILTFYDQSEIDISFLTKGTYLIVVKMDGYVSVKKIVKL